MVFESCTMKSPWYFEKIALHPLKPGAFRKERLAEEPSALKDVYSNYMYIFFLFNTF